MANPFEETVTEMRDNLVCQICESRPRPGRTQWFRCLNLHQICQDCRAKGTNCCCGQPISRDHCQMTEKLLNTKRMKLNCKNTKYGCRQVLADYILEDHESECIYRPVYAFFCSIGSPFTCKDFIERTKEWPEGIYPSKQMLNLEDLKAYENGQGQGHRFQFESKTFIFVNMFSGPQMHAFLYIVGSPNEAKKYSYTLKYFGSKSSITYVGQVAAIDESFGTVISTYKYLGISRMALRQFINVDGKIEYSLEVKNSMEEIKDET